MKRRSFLIVMVIIMVLVAALSVVGCGEADKLAITITNKQDLTAEWVEGSAARELEVAFVLGEAQAEGLPYLVETSDSGVVAVGDDNKTLTAEGQGTAIITVKATLDDGNEISDSVSISVIPYLRGVEISNKEDLQKVWVLGDASRTINVNFKPEYYNTNKPEYTVVSSDSSIVEVGEDKATLTAKAIGTVTITVSAGDRSDTVEIIVRPALESISITNKEALEAVWNNWSVVREIELAFAPADHYSVDKTPVEVVCEPENIVLVDGLKLTAKAIGQVTVTVSAAGKSDSFTVNIERSAPVMSFLEMSGFEETAEGGVINGVADKGIELPRALAKTGDGVDITSNIDIELIGDEGELKDGIFTGKKGEYQIKYTSKDTVNAELVTTKIVTVKIWRNLILRQDNTWEFINQYVEDADQKLTLTTYGFQTLAFNIEPGKYYYAEAEYDVSRGVPGMAHFLEDDTNRWLSSSVANWGGFDYKFIDFDTSLFAAHNKGVWTLQEGEEWLNVIYAWQLKGNRGLSANENPNVHKIAIVRVGDYFINFWNDQYVMMTTNKYYADKDTIPGLFFGAGGASNLSVSKISYFSGKDQVMAKVNELTHNGKDVNASYVPDSWALPSLNTDNCNFTSYEYSEEKGLSYDFTEEGKGFNDGMTSNYVWFDGDFTYQFDYEYTSGTNGANDTRMRLELRNRFWYGDGGVQFGVDYLDGKFNKLLLNSPGLQDPHQWDELGDFDASKGFRFTITRKLHEDYAEITMKVQSLANPDQVHTRVVKFSDDPTKTSDGVKSVAHWNAPVTIQWHNQIAGKFSNITWSNSVE